MKGLDGGFITIGRKNIARDIRGNMMAEIGECVQCFLNPRERRVHCGKGC